MHFPYFHNLCLPDVKVWVFFKARGSTVMAPKLSVSNQSPSVKQFSVHDNYHCCQIRVSKHVAPNFSKEKNDPILKENPIAVHRSWSLQFSYLNYQITCTYLRQDT